MYTCASVCQCVCVCVLYTLLTKVFQKSIVAIHPGYKSSLPCRTHRYHFLVYSLPPPPKEFEPKTDPGRLYTFSSESVYETNTYLICHSMLMTLFKGGVTHSANTMLKTAE